MLATLWTSSTRCALLRWPAELIACFPKLFGDLGTCEQKCLGGQDMERPLYMQPKDAISYNVCDGIVRPRTAIIDEVKKAEAWCAACLGA